MISSESTNKLSVQCGEPSPDERNDVLQREARVSDAKDFQAISDYWDRDGLGQRIIDALVASGHDLNAVSIDDLGPLDHFHGGGKWATHRLAERAELSQGAKVLDVGGGLGGPARTLAVAFGCQVTVIDLTPSYVEAAARLTALLGLDDRVTHQLGNALDLPFDDGTFDVVWTQNSGMNIADKETLYAGFHRVLRAGGILATQEPMAGPVQPPIFPLMWAQDERTNFLRTSEEMQQVIKAAGFRTRIWEKMGKEPAQPNAPKPAYRIQSMIMGEELAAISKARERNSAENRIAMMHAVCDRV